MVDPVMADWGFDALVHAAHVRDEAGVSPVVDVAFHAVHVDHASSLVMPDSTMVKSRGPASNWGQLGAT